MKSVDPPLKYLGKFELRASVIRFHLEGKSNQEILRLHEGQKISKMKMWRILKRYYETGGLGDRDKAGRPRLVRTPEMVKKLRDLIRKNPERSAVKIAKDYNLAREPVRLALREDLRLKAYKKHKIHGVTKDQKTKRFIRSKMMRTGAEVMKLSSRTKSFLCCKSPTILKMTEFGLLR